MTHRSQAVVLIAVAATLLTGCTSDSPAPPPTSSSSPPATPAPTDDAGALPTPRFGDGCAALVPEDLVAAIFSYPVEPHDLLAAEYAAWPSIPRYASVAQIGGMLCEWSNGQGYSSATGANAFRGLRVAVLPEAGEGWDRMVDYYGFPPETGQVFCNPGGCGIDVFVDGYWFTADIALDPTESPLAAVQDVAERLREAGADFGAPSTRTTTDSPRVPTDCAVTLPADLVDTVFGAGHGLDTGDGGGGWSLWAEAALQLGNDGCGWYSETRGVSTTWLHDGATLARELGADDGTPVELSSLESNESASISCTDGSCGIDILVRDHWIQVRVDGTSDPAAAAAQFAEHLAGLVRD
jgi:hypothetical protein